MNRTERSGRALARAHANIALAKYWGKADELNNVPAVPSISVTLEALTTTTEVRFDPSLGCDELELDGRPGQGRQVERVAKLLDRVRAIAGIDTRARVVSTNSFPTGSGLASSASGFAALTLAAMGASGMAIDRDLASDLARRASASAARSVHGGFVRLRAGEPGSGLLPAEPIAPASHWDLRVVVAVTSKGPKKVGSTEGMGHTARTSPYYESWLKLCPRLAAQVESAIERRDLRALGEAAEQSALAMHACAMASAPGLVYLEPATVGCVHAVRAMRDQGLAAWATIDAGPHVKVITSPEDAAKVRDVLRGLPGVVDTIVSRVGGAASVDVRRT